MKNFSLSLLIIAILSGISSCKKNTSNEAVADVFARSIMYNGNVGYSTVHSVVSTGSTISAATVDLPGGGTLSLYDHDGTGTAFFKDTSMAGLYPNPEPPVTGVYTYHVTFGNGEKKDYTNTLTNDFLLPVVIDSLYKLPDGISLRLKWEPVAGADAYQIRISAGQNIIFPWMELSDHSQLYNERLISTFANYLPGTLTFEVRAMKYETSDEKYLQSFGYASASIDM